jgi:signal transduction histidine kinase
VTGVAVPTGAIGPRSASLSKVLTLLASAQLGGAAVLTVSALVLVSLAGPQDPVQPSGWPRVAMPVALLELSVVGFLIARRHRGKPIGWIFAVAGLDGLVGEVAKQYANVGLSHGSGSLPGADTMAWLACVSAASTAFPVLTFGFLLFPDGHLPSRRWRPVAWVAASASAMVILVDSFAPGPLRLAFPSMTNPFGLEALSRRVLEGIARVAFVCLLACVLASVASMLLRLRRSGGEQRQQLKWVTYAASIAAIETVAWILWSPGPTVGPVSVDGPMVTSILAIAFVVAMFNSRRHHIDVVVSKTVLFGLATAVITILYLTIVVGVGTAIGSREQPSLALSFIGALVAAAVFQPVRERVERLANRLVYGERAAPYEVLAQFSRHLATTYPSSDLLPRMARLLADGTGAAGAEVWLRSGDGLRRVACWPDTAALPSSRAPRSDARTVLVQHHGEVLGSLAVHTRPGSPLTPPEERLLADLAGQAGLILRNARLIEDLRTSRERLITARDAERRRLERDIRERVERRLAAVAAALEIQRPAVDTSEERQAVTQLRRETANALKELQDLARGVYPPLLADQGLVAALQAHSRSAELIVDIEADGLGRHAQDVEAAAYFCCLEALQNVAKHARARRVVVALSHSSGRLQFGVNDDGVGFEPASTGRGSGLQNIADRAEALSGRVEVSSSPGHGTVVNGWLPSSPVERAP